MSAPEKVISKSFDALLETMPGRLRWVIAYVPVDVRKTWGARGRIRVSGEINGFPFRTSLFPTRAGRHFLLVNKTMQKGAAARSGQTAKVRIQNDTEERVATMPVELERQLRQSKALRKWFDALSYSIRKDLCRRVQQPKSQEARDRQAERLAELLYSAMDAERDLPPWLRTAFARRPRAYLGWQRMSPSHRRHQLLGIFYYRSPEARERRTDKMLDAAEVLADRDRS
jgi:uncharacterized protein YdeI (YjbR/CyaY-like superfamily)